MPDYIVIILVRSTIVILLIILHIVGPNRYIVDLGVLH